MLSHDRLRRSPRALRTFTGLDQAEFEKLLVPCVQAWNMHVSMPQHPEHIRKRHVGDGRKARLLTVEDKLLFILFYFKIYPRQEVIAFLFDMSQGRTNEWIHTLSTVLQLALGDPRGVVRGLPERHPQNLEQVLTLCVSVDVIIDGTERRTRRPTEAERQKLCYSEKKMHTVKSNLIVDVEERLVRYLSSTYAGSVHDKRICDQKTYTFPPGCVLFQDTSFQGYEPDDSRTYQPKKKPQGQELTPADKAENTMISRMRIVVEHVLAGIKRCHIVQDVFRNTKAHFDDLVMEIACRRHNLRAISRYVSEE